MNIVGAAHGEVVGEGECEVGYGACVKVKREHGAGVCDDGLELNGVDKRLGEGSQLERGVVEAVNVVPDCK